MQLRSAVVAAIGRQLGSADGTDDPEAQRATAHALVQEALATGGISTVNLAEVEQFTAGNTAMLVARVNTDLSFVVKVDRSPDLISEAYMLRRVGSDPSLPGATRRAFPRVYAIDDEPPIYGYLMEHLSGFTPLHTSMATIGAAGMRKVVGELWDSVLEPAYRATRSTRVVPNVDEDYFVRARHRLAEAASLGLLPGPAEPMRIEAGVATSSVPNGWGGVLTAASVALADVRPTFSTFVHGDPNPENILWRRDDDGTPSFRLIDPKTWWIGDYLFDAAKIGHYLSVTLPVEQMGQEARWHREGSDHVISYDRDALADFRALDGDLLAGVERFAEDPELPDCREWRTRYQLALAANLLGIVGPRLIKGDRALAGIAFGEAIRILAPMTDGAVT